LPGFVICCLVLFADVFCKLIFCPCDKLKVREGHSWVDD